MKQTTALTKICRLKKKIRAIQGGQGAGKTIAILIILINYASGNSYKEVIVASAELTKMRGTVIKDFVKVMRSFGIYDANRFKAETHYKFPNGSFIKFIGLDKEDVGKGLRSDVVYVNEANKINLETFRQLTSRTSWVYLDYNPDDEFYVHDELSKRSDFEMITLTFEDNEFINPSERDEILMYKELGYNADGTILSKYWANKWRVYGLGEVGMLDGIVYEDWEIIEEIPKEAKPIGLGLDFGYVNPAAWIAGYKMDKHFYFDQIIYESKLTNQDMGEMIIEAELDEEVSYCDNAEPKSIDELYSMGVNAHPCADKKDLIKFAIKKMNRRKFFITRRSVETISELRTYVWDKDKAGRPTGKPIKKKDHAMNAIQYLVASYGQYDGDYG